MKRFLCIVTMLAVFAGSVRADEGMWMLPLLQKMNAKDMKQLGCKLSPKEIYDINNSSLKDAIVQFGGGCTGEIVSNRGLLLTNHHCGYSNIQKLSSVEHDYLKDGYWAMNLSEELPCKGLTVTFLESMQEVTDIIKKAKAEAEKKFRKEKNAEVLIAEEMTKVRETLIAEAEKANLYCKANITSFYDENIFYLIVYKTFRDVRFVGAPPSSIGKFGADTDNWMWPRHTGDFSMFRVYADANNNPADYSKNNVPYTPKQFLKISLNGIKEGDFTMIMGFPGRTTRFQTSPELKQQIKENDIRIAARTIRQDIMLEDMLADPKVKIQYASKYSGSSNGWKKWKGMKIAFENLNIISRAEQEEIDFLKWVNEDKKRTKIYGNSVNEIRASIFASEEANLAFTLASEALYPLELPQFAGIFKKTYNKSLKDGKDTLSALSIAYGEIAPKYKDYSASTDKKIMKAMLEYYRTNARPKYFPKNLVKDFSTFDIDSWVDNLFNNTCFADADSLKTALSAKGEDVLKDPAVAAFDSFIKEVLTPITEAQKHREALSKARETYTAGLLEWKNGEPSYPDANFTMRFTYGTVKGYSPKDGVLYNYYTTLKGVMEKEDPDNWEFVVPDKLKQLWKFKDFGRYTMADGTMPVAFLSNNDITGGNSGSPIMNANGELIGLAFDGNWESMSSDVMFEPDLQRCINVDIRYVLFIVEKFGGAKWLVDEMTIVE